MIIAAVTGELTTVPSPGPRWCFAELNKYKRSEGQAVIKRYGEF